MIVRKGDKGRKDLTKDFKGLPRISNNNKSLSQLGRLFDFTTRRRRRREEEEEEKKEKEKMKIRVCHDCKS